MKCKTGIHEVDRADYCHFCAQCAVCHLPLTIEEYQWNLDRWGTILKSNPSEAPDAIFEHPHCLNPTESASLLTETSTIPQTVFDKVNASRLLKSAVDNIREYSRLPITMLSIEDQIKHLREIEKIAADVYATLRAKKRDIETDINELYNTRTETSRELKQREKAEAERVASLSPAPQTAARVEKKQLSKEEKAIQQLMQATGLNKEDATAQIAEAKSIAEKRGQRPTIN